MALLLGGACVAQGVPDDAADRKAGDACESAVADTVRAARGRAAQEVQFTGARRALSAMPGNETGVKGEGRYRPKGGRNVPFSYTCAFNATSGRTHGVMFSDQAGATAPGAEAWQPDLSRFSPDACEVAIAAALKEKHPRVDRIRFGSDSRQLRRATDSRTLLEGGGAAARAPGMNAAPFSYGCEFENRSGRVVGVKISE